MATTKKKLDLTDDNHDGDLQINKEFSERYERYRSKEVLQQLKDKYGDQIWESEASESDEHEGSEDDSESSSDEVDDSELFDEKFLRVLGALKTKDKAIYDQNAVFYTKDDVVDLDRKKELKRQAKESLGKPSKTEKLDLIGYHKKLIKEKKGLTAEDEEMENQTEEPKTGLGYYEELKSIKQDLLKAAGDENDEDDLIVGKKVLELSDDEAAKNDPKTILETKSKEDKCIKKLSKYWKSESLDKNEQFLRDFIMKKAYLSDEDEEEEKADGQPDWTKQQLEEEDRSEEEYDSDDSTHRKLVKTYESTRFHHEEPDAEKIKRFPRQIESIRDIALKKKKKEKRAEMKERKKQQKEAELRKLRELKRNEIRDKISLLEKTTGAKLASKLKDVDIDMLVDDTEFDGDKYDQMIANLFNDEYYGVEDNAIEKPKFEYDSDVDDEKYYDELDQGLVADEDDYKGEIIEPDNAPDEEEEGDGINEFDEDELDEASGTKMSKKKRLRLKKKEKQEQKKRDKSKGKNYGIYEDIIDGQGVRFKYRKTRPANYGLTEEEILLADEKELNRWVSLGKSQLYEDNEHDIEKYDRRGRNFELKKKILKSLYGDSDDESNRKVVNRNEPDEDENEVDQGEVPESEGATNGETGENKRKKKKQRRRKNKKAKLTEE